MAKRPQYQRGPAQFKVGCIGAWPADKPKQQDVAERASYIPSGEHKNYTSDTGAWTMSARSSRTLCKKYTPKEFARFNEGVEKAVGGACISSEFRGDFPSRAWIWVDTVLHELRLSNEVLGHYHAFPINYGEDYPEDPLGKMKDCPCVRIQD
ncbi:MAG: hypothetical protein ABSG84_19065 [Acidobacteriaceae bacterium]|jgi:hypothetical protein